MVHFHCFLAVVHGHLASLLIESAQLKVLLLGRVRQTNGQRVHLSPVSGSEFGRVEDRLQHDVRDGSVSFVLRLLVFARNKPPSRTVKLIEPPDFNPLSLFLQLGIQLLLLNVFIFLLTLCFAFLDSFVDFVMKLLPEMNDQQDGHIDAHRGSHTNPQVPGGLLLQVFVRRVRVSLRLI